MAAQDLNRTAPFGAIAIHNAISFVENGLVALKDWNMRRKTVAALNGLSDHELQDIGLDRADIRPMADRITTQR